MNCASSSRLKLVLSPTRGQSCSPRHRALFDSADLQISTHPATGSSLIGTNHIQPLPRLNPALSRSHSRVLRYSTQPSQEQPEPASDLRPQSATANDQAQQSASAYLLRQALLEEQEEQGLSSSSSRRQRPPIPELREPAWDGDEPQDRAIRRILEDTYKPLRIKVSFQQDSHCYSAVHSSPLTLRRVTRRRSLSLRHSKLASSQTRRPSQSCPPRQRQQTQKSLDRKTHGTSSSAHPSRTSPLQPPSAVPPLAPASPTRCPPLHAWPPPVSARLTTRLGSRSSAEE